MKNTKKFIAVALTLAIMMGMCCGASSGPAGDVVELPSGVTGTTTTPITSEAVYLKKTVKVYNPGAIDTETVSVVAPNLYWHYTLEGVDTGKSVTDADGTKVATKKGIVENVKVINKMYGSWEAGSVAFINMRGAGNGTLTYSAAGTDNDFYFGFDFHSVNFGAAGVYRYKITETTSFKRDEVDTTNSYYDRYLVTEGTCGHVRYLDVYVKDNEITTATGADRWVVYGFSCFEANDDVTPSTTKTSGFTASSTTTSDSYYTYNIRISKSLINDAGNNYHSFPFDLKWTAPTTYNPSRNDSTVGVVTPERSQGGTTYLVNPYNNETYVGIDEEAVSTRTGQYLEFCGVPYGVGMEIKEKIDVDNTYTVVSTGADTNISSETVIGNSTTPTSTTGTAVVSARTTPTTSLTNANVTVTNTLKLISPTGIILRFAPYILMLGVGIFLFILGRKRRKDDAEQA